MGCIALSSLQLAHPLAFLCAASVDCVLGGAYNRLRPFLQGLVRKKNEEEKFHCQGCGTLVTMSSLEPVFKKEYVSKDGRLNVPTEMPHRRRRTPVALATAGADSPPPPQLW